MSDQIGSLVAAIEALIDALEQSGIEYALGGAIAYGAWGEPRATRDIDLNLWVSRSGLEHSFDILHGAGVTIDRDRAIRESEERGMFVGYSGEYRVDVFVPSVAFYDEARRRRQRIRFGTRETWVLSAEVLAVFKMLFFRPKDIADILRLLEIQGAKFDRQFVRTSLAAMLGDEDERLKEWDRLVR